MIKKKRDQKLEEIVTTLVVEIRINGFLTKFETKHLFRQFF